MADVDDGSIASSEAGGAAGTAGAAGAGRRRAAKRRRQKNDPDRTARVNVRVTPDELATLTERADAQGVTVPRFLLEAALAPRGSSTTATQRLDALAELFRFQRTLSGIGDNINQLAKHANMDGQFPQQAFDLRVQLMGVFWRLDELLDKVNGPAYYAGPMSGPGSQTVTTGAAGAAAGVADDDLADQDEWSEALRGPLADTDWEQ
ncbi:MAG TPA: MobC family plasmid mobilization relaxosome protein [Kribbella sp.]